MSFAPKRALSLEIKESFVMSKKLATLALAAALSAATVVPAAQADPGYRGHRHASHHGHHHGRGHWHNGKWIALGILGAAVGAAVADSEYRDCYYRHGRRYCND
jgi:hypothetical protein